MKYAVAVFLLAVSFMPLVTHAALGDVTIIHGTVERIASSERREVPGTTLMETVQSLMVELEDGRTVTVNNDRIVVEVGSRVYVAQYESVDGYIYTLHDADRGFAMGLALFLFAAAIIGVGGWIGVRALVSLGLSLGVILYILAPLLISGYPPALTSLACAALMLGVVMLVTHGPTRMTLAAYLASLAAVTVAVFLGDAFVSFAHLSGFADDASSILNISTGSALQMEGLLLGALIIGALGIVDDLAVTQVAAIGELKSANPGLTNTELYARAMRIGREHLGAVVNTLVLAYVGASLPLLLLFALSTENTALLLNSEVIAVEVVRAAVGSVALALVVPVATILALWAIRGRTPGHAPHTHTH